MLLVRAGGQARRRTPTQRRIRGLRRRRRFRRRRRPDGQCRECRRQWRRRDSAGCRSWPGKIKAGGIGSMLRLGSDPAQALLRAGEPESRAKAWRWCALDRKRPPRKVKKGKRRKSKAAAKRPVVGVFDSNQRIVLALSSPSQPHSPRHRPREHSAQVARQEGEAPGRPDLGQRRRRRSALRLRREGQARSLRGRRGRLGCVTGHAARHGRPGRPALAPRLGR